MLSVISQLPQGSHAQSGSLLFSITGIASLSSGEVLSHPIMPFAGLKRGFLLPDPQPEREVSQKNRVPLYFTSVDLASAYHQIPITELQTIFNLVHPATADAEEEEV